MLPPEELGCALRKVRAFVFDVDGVFTDGGILCDDTGELYRTFNAKDTFAVRNAVAHGYVVGIITGGSSISIVKRFATCWVPQEDICLRSLDKAGDFEAFLRRHGLEAGEVLACGDDFPDIGMIEAAGIGTCPSDAAAQCREAATYVTSAPGGKGAVRELIEMVMCAQGCWDFDPSMHRRAKDEFLGRREKNAGEEGSPLFLETFITELRRWISGDTL